MAWFQLAFWYCACFPLTFTEHAALFRAHSISRVVNQKDVSMPARTRHVDEEK